MLKGYHKKMAAKQPPSTNTKTKLDLMCCLSNFRKFFKQRCKFTNKKSFLPPPWVLKYNNSSGFFQMFPKKQRFCKSVIKELSFCLGFPVHLITNHAKRHRDIFLTSRRSREWSLQPWPLPQARHAAAHKGRVGLWPAGWFLLHGCLQWVAGGVG